MQRMFEFFSRTTQRERAREQLLLAKSKEGDVEAVRALLEEAVDPNAKTKHGETPLHVATINRHSSVVQLLLDAQANPDAGNDYEKTPLHKASSKGSSQIIESLLSAGANPNAQNKDGETPLHKASSKGHLHVVDLLLKAHADPNAQNKLGQTPLHFACNYHGSTNVKIVRALLAAGADPHARDKDGRKPFHASIQSREHPRLGNKTLQTLQALVAAGATWDATCDEMVARGLTWEEAPALRLCTLLWACQRADDVRFTDIPIEVVRRGVISTLAFIDELTSSRDIVLRGKLCLVGSSCAGKTSLIKSITAQQPQLVHADDRTIGIDHFPLRFAASASTTDRTATTEIHEVTCWDFAGQDAYQVAHALFFSPRTLFLVCVDLDAFVTAFLQASIMANMRSQEVQLMDEFIDRTVMRWVQLVLARQPDAEFVFIATKEDLLAENRVTAQLFRKSLQAKLKQVETTVQSTRHKLQAEEKKPTFEHGGVGADPSPGGVDTTKPNVVYVSCLSPASVQAARTHIEELVVKSDRSFQMPDSYSKALEAILAIRQAAKAEDITQRIRRVFAPVDSLPAALQIEPQLCRTILQTLHDLGDVLWYEDLGVELFRDTVILDPLLLIDFIRQVINHKHTGVTMPHADLKSQPFWIGLSDPKQMEAMKLMLQRFHLVYSADEGRIMEWDSDLIVPAFWQTKTPAAWLFLGDILRLDANATTRDASSVDWEYHFNSTNQSRDVDAVRVHWEYHFEFKLPSSLFDHLVVASVSPHVKFDAGPDWILYREQAVAACRIMVGRDAASLHRTIHVEAVVAKAATQKDADKLWAVFTQLCGAFVHVLRAYPGLVVSSFAWDDADNKIGLKRLMKSKAADESAAWMPPAATWRWLRRLQSDAVAQERFQ